MCKCIGRRGEQGATGPTGPSGLAEFNTLNIGSTNITAQTDINIVASAAQSGSIIFFGQMTLNSTQAISYELSIVVNSVVVSSSTLNVTGASPIGGISYVTIPVSGIVSISSGQAFQVRVVLNDYTKTTSAVGTIQYAYQ